MKEEYAKEAKEQQKRKPIEEKSVLSNSREQIEERSKTDGWTDRKIAADIGVSCKLLQIQEKGFPEDTAKLKLGEKTYFIGEVYVY